MGGPVEQSIGHVLLFCGPVAQGGGPFRGGYLEGLGRRRKGISVPGLPAAEAAAESGVRKSVCVGTLALPTCAKAPRQSNN
jgi:hypothetical protein